jgi:histidinol-phosphate phosphatase family protein
MTSIRTVFLDRDGVINRLRPGDYVTSWEQFTFLPGAKAAIAALATARLRLILVTNQRGIALGCMSAADVDELHRRMLDELGEAGQAFAAVLVCPHDIGQCACRKPQVGLFYEARRRFPDLDFAEAVLIGDALSDLEAGQGIGCRSFLIASGARRRELVAAAEARGIPVAGIGPSLATITRRYILPVCGRGTRCGGVDGPFGEATLDVTTPCHGHLDQNCSPTR